VWWLLHHGVESSVLPLEMMYEHRTYLPLVGWSVVLPWAVWSVLGGVRRERISLALGTALVVALAVAAHARNDVWSSRESLWADALARAPTHPRSHNNYAMAISERDHEAALPHYRRALELAPAFQDAHHNLAISLHAVGRLEEAQGHFEIAIRLRPADALAHHAFSRLLIEQGRSDEAGKHLEATLHLQPTAQAYFDLGLLRSRQGRLVAARELLATAVELSPNHHGVYSELGRVLARMGDFGAAAAELDRSLEIRARPAVAARRARLSWAEGAWSDALQRALAAVELDPESSVAASTAAWMLSTAPDAALRDPQRALRLVAVAREGQEGVTPDLAEARSAALARLGRFDEAAELAGELAAGASVRSLHEAAGHYRRQVQQYRARRPIEESGESAELRVVQGVWNLVSPWGAGSQLGDPVD
jgi:tetratricopeptide (TPR) repeat protein